MTGTFPLLSIMDGRECVGFVRSHAKGFEAVVGTSGEHSLGTFESKDAAIAAIVRSVSTASS